jgi:opacity protein-like surface antigen
MAREGRYLGGGLVYNDPQSSDIDFLQAGTGFDFKFGYNFGPVALEANWMGSSHDDRDPGFGSADFGGFSLDLRVFVSYVHDPTQLYFLVGVGNYWLDEFDPTLAADTTFRGGGLNLGGGVERYLNENVSLDFGITYRIITYSEIDIGRTEFLLDRDISGNMLTLEAGLVYHF